MASSSTVSLASFVDSWLDALEKAKADATANGLTNNARLHENKYIKDLLDALSWQLRNYIEHPDPDHPTRKITLSNDRLVVSDDNLQLSGKTRKARLEILMQKILKEKGSDGGKRYAELEPLFKQMPFAPTKLASTAQWKTVNTSKTSLPDAVKAKTWQYYYDPRNVDNELETGTVWVSDVDMQDIDQFRNEDGRFNKTMKSRFGVPDYREINSSLVANATKQLGPFSFASKNLVNLSKSNSVPPARDNIKQWAQDRMKSDESTFSAVSTGLKQNALNAPSAQNAINIAQNPTPSVVASNTTSATGKAVTPEQATKAAVDVQKNMAKTTNGGPLVNLGKSPVVPASRSNMKQWVADQKAVADGLKKSALIAPGSQNLTAIAQNPTPSVIASNTIGVNGQAVKPEQTAKAANDVRTNLKNLMTFNNEKAAKGKNLPNLMTFNDAPDPGLAGAVQANLAAQNLHVPTAQKMNNILQNPTPTTIKNNAVQMNGKTPTNEQAVNGAIKVAGVVNK